MSEAISYTDLIHTLKKLKQDLGPPPLTLIKTGSIELLSEAIEKKHGSFTRPPMSDPYPAYFSGIPVEESLLIPPQMAVLISGTEVVGIINFADTVSAPDAAT